MKSTTPLQKTAGFLLTKLGQQAFESFSEKLAPYGLRPRHCGALAALAALDQPSQQDLGRTLGVVPSAVVGLIDDLEGLGAIERIADPDDRRRFALALTAKGKKLLDTVTALAGEVDTELLASLDARQREAFIKLLAQASPKLTN